MNAIDVPGQSSIVKRRPRNIGTDHRNAGRMSLGIKREGERYEVQSVWNTGGSLREKLTWNIETARRDGPALVSTRMDVLWRAQIPSPDAVHGHGVPV